MLQNALSTGEGERRALGEQPKFELAAFALPPPSQRRKTQACTDTLAEPRVGSSPTGVAARQDLQHALGGGESGWRSGVTSTHKAWGRAGVRLPLAGSFSCPRIHSCSFCSESKEHCFWQRAGQGKARAFGRKVCKES